MNSNYVARALCYHGQPLQKIWDDERNVEDLRQLGLAQPNYSVYQERQKYFTFQERAKRLKMHQFLARKALDLYDKQLVANIMEDAVLAQGKDCLTPQPPYEYFLNVKDKGKSWRYRMGALKPGFIIYAAMQKMIGASRLVVKPLCAAEPLHFYLADIPIKAHIFQDNFGTLSVGQTRNFGADDLICCEILEVSADAERLTLGMAGVYNKSPGVKLGQCQLTDLPKYYRQIHGVETAPHYEDQLVASLEFQNPNYDVLFQMNGLQPHENLSLMSHIKAGFPEQDYAPELRQKQASQWAFRSVADGIEHFKNGQQVEAFQCLNKALNIDPRNVEGLVARGALYANRGSFLKAIEDFEKALKLNKYHVNARKYMGETLVALGRSYEEDNRLPEAIKAYSDCLNVLPQHEQARQSLEALQRPAKLCQQPPPSQLYGAKEILPLPAKEGAIELTATDEDSSSSGSDSEERAVGQKPSQSQFSQPYYAMALDKDKLAMIDAQKANEFKLDDDETMSSVRKLLRDASKHKREKKKKGNKKKKDKEKDKERSKSKEKKKQQPDLDTVEMLKKIDFSEAYRLMTGARNEAQLKATLQSYLEQQERSTESPPPAPPSLKKPQAYDPVGASTSAYAAAAAAAAVDGAEDQEQPPPAPKLNEQQKLSFQIKKRQLQMDKFGLLRLATPLSRQHSSSRSRSRSRSRSPKQRHSSGNEQRQLTAISARRNNHFRDSRSRSRSRSSRSPRFRRRRSRSSRSRSRSRSPPTRYGRGAQRYNNNFRREQQRSRSRSINRRRSPSRRRTPSPFVPRLARHRRSRSRSPSRSSSPRSRHHYQAPYQPRGGRGRGRYQSRWLGYGNRFVSRAVEPEQDEAPPTTTTTTTASNGDRKDEAEETQPSGDGAAPADGPTIEEIDEMIKEAQKERKQGIIEGDKHILKKAKTAAEH